MATRSLVTFVALLLASAPASAQYVHDRRGDEPTRLQAHFAAAAAALPDADAGPRAELRAHILAYAEGGLFPKNRDFTDTPTPYFVDADGTHCGMAHLLAITGEEELVARVAATDNNVYADDLAVDPEFGAWLDEHELTADEAARIQPSYTFHLTDCLCGEWDYEYGGTPARVVFEGTITALDEYGYWKSVEVGQILAGSDPDVAPGDVLNGGGDRLTRGETGLFAVYDDLYAEGDAVRRLPTSDECPARAVYPSPPRLDRDLLVEAVMSSDCRETLVAHDPRWDYEWTEGMTCASTSLGALWPLAPAALLLLSASARRRTTKRRR